MKLNVIENTDVLQQPSRRNVLQGMAALTASLAAGSILADDDEHHAKHSSVENSLVQAAWNCIKTGQACIEHCIGLFKQGDTSTAVCMETATEMLAMCTALSQMASYHSVHLIALAKVCAAVCKDCEQECRKHEQKHAACKDCAESCANCKAECEKVAA